MATIRLAGDHLYQPGFTIGDLHPFTGTDCSGWRRDAAGAPVSGDQAQDPGLLE